MSILFDIFFIVIVTIGVFQFVGWLWRLPSKIIQWYYDNFFKTK
jgi:hypothetical protein